MTDITRDVSQQKYNQSLEKFVSSVNGNATVENDFVGNIKPYQINQRMLALNVLRNNFPTVERILGDTVFTSLAQVYGKYYPSTWWDVNIFGDQFPEFLASQINSVKADAYDWALIAEIAQLEYAFIDRYYYPGHDATPEVLIEFAHFDYEAQQLVKECHPNLVITYNCLDRFQSVANGEKFTSPEYCSDDSNSKAKLKIFSASVFRQNFQVVSAFSCSTANL